LIRTPRGDSHPPGRGVCGDVNSDLLVVKINFRESAPFSLLTGQLPSTPPL
jgi:hypothetical protein